MNILITGGAGFIGQHLARALLLRGTVNDLHGKPTAITRLRLFDMIKPSWGADPRVQCIAGDIADAAAMRAVVGSDTQSIFHLAAVPSGGAEANFDLGLRVNLDGTRALLEATRQLPAPPKFIFSSTAATFGGALPNPVPDDWPQTPQGSYGAQKAMAELLINDMSRRGMIDARIPRLPTITVRPGAPNAAASGFASGIVREPVVGKEAIIPVGPNAVMWILSPAKVIEHLMALHDFTADQLAAAGLRQTRSLSLPGLSVSVGDMYEALCDVAGPEAGRLVKWQPDPAVERLVHSWPAAFEAKAGLALGLRGDASFDDIVRQHLATLT